MNDGKPHAKLPFSCCPFRLLTLLMPKRRKAHSASVENIDNQHCALSSMCRRSDNNKINAFYLIFPPRTGVQRKNKVASAVNSNNEAN